MTGLEPEASSATALPVLLLTERPLPQEDPEWTLALPPVGGHEVGVAPPWVRASRQAHMAWDRLPTALPLGGDSSRSSLEGGSQAAQTKRAELSWWEASIWRAQDLLPMGLRRPKVDGSPPPGSWPFPNSPPTPGSGPQTTPSGLGPTPASQRERF